MRRGTEFDKKGFINYFRALPEDPKILRVFNRKDNFSVGDDATFVARTFYKTTTVVKYLGRRGALAGVTLNKSLFGACSDLLLEGTERTVELRGDPRQGWRLAEREPEELGAFEDELYRGEMRRRRWWPPCASPSRLSRGTGVAYVSPTTRELGACEFVDDEQFCAPRLSFAARRQGVRRAGGGVAVARGRRLRDVVARCGALAAERKPADFDARDLEDDLARLLAKHDARDTTRAADVDAAAAAGAAGARGTALLEKDGAAAAP